MENQKDKYPVNLCRTIEQVNDMDNPFQMITDTFHPDYRVNLSIQGLEGSIMLTLSNERGVVAKRLISAAQRNDPLRLRKCQRQ
ncbi:hypothetical protein ALP50_05027, partial [Pseudomonas syringae pv. spinaceae]